MCSYAIPTRRNACASVRISWHLSTLFAVRVQKRKFVSYWMHVGVFRTRLLFCVPDLNLWRLTTPIGGRTAPLTSKRFVLYIYLTNIGTEYFNLGIYSPFFFPLQNAVCFIILTYLVPVLFTFYIFIQQI